MGKGATQTFIVETVDIDKYERYNTNMSEINVNPQDVINDLLRQITDLTGQTAILRAALNQFQAKAEAVALFILEQKGQSFVI